MVTVSPGASAAISSAVSRFSTLTACPSLMSLRSAMNGLTHAALIGEEAVAVTQPTRDPRVRTGRAHAKDVVDRSPRSGTADPELRSTAGHRDVSGRLAPADPGPAVAGRQEGSRWRSRVSPMSRIAAT